MAERGVAAMERVWIGLGSNLGDRDAHLDRALARLEAAERITCLATSKRRETAPVGGPPQGPYLNAAAELETSLAPRALLDVLLGIERDLGRVRDVPSGPRTIDLDVLLWRGRIIDEPGLEVPHPRLLERRFALEPLCDLAPDEAHPISGRALAAHLAEVLAAESESEGGA